MSMKMGSKDMVVYRKIGFSVGSDHYSEIVYLTFNPLPK